MWHSVVFTVDRDSDSYVYIDSVVDGTTANLEIGDDISSTLDLAIGCDALGSFDMTGELQNLVIWPRELTTREAQAFATGKAF